MSSDLINAEEVSQVFWQNIASKKRYTIHCGGTRSSKTYSILQSIILHAYKHNEGNIYSIVSETMPHLKRGAMRDFFRIIKEKGLYRENNHNKSENQYKIGENIIEFFSADSSDKVHGPTRDYLFVNEIQNITYDTFFHLCTRTKKRIWADFNPTSLFWIYPNYIENVEMDKDVQYIHSTIYDNPFIEPEIKEDVERRAAKDDNYRRVYLLGEPGVLEGLIFSAFTQIESMPETKITIFGMDFGFSNDPTTLIKVGINGNDLFIDELIYQTHLTTPDLIRLMIQQGIRRNFDQIYADSADPKTIREIQIAGINCKPAYKGTDSIRHGINIIRQMNVFITKRSLNVINEFRNYRWVLDANGIQTEKPIDNYNHTIDAIRYPLVTHGIRERQKMSVKVGSYE